MAVDINGMPVPHRVACLPLIRLFAVSGACFISTVRQHTDTLA